MFGDFVLKLKELFKQQTCIHDYKPDGLGIATGLHCGRICSKCGKFE